MKRSNNLPLRNGLATYTLCLNLIEHVQPYLVLRGVQGWRVWTDLESGKIVLQVDILNLAAAVR